MSDLVHMICGSTGAGKTTYSTTLASEIGAVVFPLDEWMTALFYMDLTPAVGEPWVFERVERCQRQIWSTVRQLARLNVPSVLDFGFVRRQDRQTVAQWAMTDRIGARLHHIDVLAEERWRRVQSRNSAKGETFRFEIPRDRFEVTERLWEPPDAAEMLALNGVRISP